MSYETSSQQNPFINPNVFRTSLAVSNNYFVKRIHVVKDTSSVILVCCSTYIPNKKHFIYDFKNIIKNKLLVNKNGTPGTPATF